VSERRQFACSWQRFGNSRAGYIHQLEQGGRAKQEDIDELKRELKEKSPARVPPWKEPQEGRGGGG
jgi:hypothetical protein